jgi:hypothetical protein
MRIPSKVLKAGLFDGLAPFFRFAFYQGLAKTISKTFAKYGIDLDSVFVKLTWATICVLIVVGLVLIYKNDYFIKKYKQDFFNVGLAFLSLSALFVLFPIFPIWIWIITWFVFSLCKTEPMK